MLPSLVARDIEKGLKSYIRNEFPVAPAGGFRDESGRSILDAFLDAPDALTKGPWAEVQLPFRRLDKAELPFRSLRIDEVVPGFRPYAHQARAFERLHWERARSTLVATGTGSGKTECFLYPIVDYCLSRPRPGIKAILLYPMNALASDQARRIEALLAKLPSASLRAGLYTGDSSSDGIAPDDSRHLVRDRQLLRSNPPDILLTNYKMLDFLLMRPEDQSLWKNNGPDVLKYLVVDELHTFDGAQGTDLAVLIRRLRDRLGLGDALACVGTSATIGGRESVEELCSYASDVFGTAITPGDVIAEDRLNVRDFLAASGEEPPLGHWPDDTILSAARAAGPAGYFAQVVPLWFDEDLGFNGTDVPDDARRRLAERLPRLEGFRRLLADMKGVTDLAELARRWSAIGELREAARGTSPEQFAAEYVPAVIDSLIAMTAMARTRSGSRDAPFLNVRSQLWIRTLANVVASVGGRPRLALARDLPSLTAPMHLPLVGCRECSRIAWGACIPGGIRAGRVRVRPNLKGFYAGWFGHHQDTCLFYPVSDPEELARFRPDADGRPSPLRHELFRLCPKCGSLESLAMKVSEGSASPSLEDLRRCACGEEDAVVVRVPDMTRVTRLPGGGDVRRFTGTCPHCGAVNGLRIFGAASPSLSAAVVDQLHSSAMSGDDKVIAFSDSVQDAALRAGFLNARNYLPTCRHALVGCLSERFPSDANMKQVLLVLPGHWQDVLGRKAAGGFPGIELTEEDRALLGSAAFLSTFIAPDKEWRVGWSAFSRASAESARLLAEGAGAPDDVRRTKMQQAIECLRASRTQWEALCGDMMERLVWEGMMELGFRSENGRTVERTGAAVAYPDPGRIEQAARRLVPLLRERNGADIDAAAAGRLLAGILNQMRLSGAFSVRGFSSRGCGRLEQAFGDYLRTGNSFVAFNRSTFLPVFGRSYRGPSAVTMHPSRARQDSFNIAFLDGPGGASWFEGWVRRHLPAEAVAKSQMEDVMRTILAVLAGAGLVEEIPREDDGAWVLPMDPWKISRNVAAWRCTCCGRRLFFSADGRTRRLWNGMKCLSAGCPGVLEEDADFEDRKSTLYEAAPVRIHAREHTSLIDAEARNAIEASFGRTAFPWSVNLLSATSTLEMGIDIGDLSTVLLASLPPTQASYLQRIGRAGRRDGNALAVTMIDRRPHDQYFWAAPKEMLSGDVTPPGVFLKAVAVLERQLLAFAIGRWVADTAPASKELSGLSPAMRSCRLGRTDRFPGSFLLWTEEHAGELADGFIALFARPDGTNALTAEGQTSLRRFVTGRAEDAAASRAAARPGLAERLRNVLEQAYDQHERFRQKTKELAACRKDLEKRPQDEWSKGELEAVRKQDEAIRRMMTAFSEKSLFNHLTDEGLLPNYAFPEEGVQVHSVILSHRDWSRRNGEAPDDPDGTGRPRSGVVTFEFNRAAGQALRELAPGSTFYVNQHMLRVDQVGLRGAGDFEDWRFCSECTHAERVDPTVPPPAACPHCGSTLFGDIGRVRRMLRTTEITAVADSRLDRIDDRSEDRTVGSFRHDMLIDVKAQDVDTAWQVDDERFRFGFEFLRRVTLREVNFGAAAPAGGEDFRVAGGNRPASGFEICRCCGKVRRRDLRPGERQHDFGCPWSQQAETPADSPWINGFFLYRETESEAVRIRVPVCDMLDLTSADRGTASFVAALRLGLKRHFHGEVSHLSLTVASDPIPGTDTGRNRYVVIYDTIPGGSGYLKDLARLTADTHRPEAMIRLFQEAYEAVCHCACARDPEKDGCYRCVYQYGDQASREYVSRREAEAILQQICRFRPEDYRPAGSVDEIPPLVSSALESRMLKRLAELPGTVFSSRPGKNREVVHELTVLLTPEARGHWKEASGEDPGERMTWTVRAQVNVPGAECSRPDFTIVPRSELLANRFPRLHGHVFTDGWTYHAAKLADDTAKRQSIMNAGGRVWSLSWDDLTEEPRQEEREEPRETYGSMLLRPQGTARARETFGKLFRKDAGGRPLPSGFGFESAEGLLQAGRSSFDWLVEWLRDPFGFETRMRAAMQHAALTLDLYRKPAGRVPRALSAAQGPEAGRDEDLLWLCDADSPLPFAFAATIVRDRTTKACTLSAALCIDDAPLAAADGGDVRRRKDGKAAWAGFWQSANALQFLDRAWIMTASNEESGLYSTFFEPPQGVVVPSGVVRTEADERWQDLFEELESDADFFGNLLEPARAIAARGLPAPDDIVDGCPGHVCTSGQGLAWKRAGRSVLFFADADLTDEFRRAMPSMTACLAADGVRAIGRGEPKAFALFTNATDDWLDGLAQAIGILEQ